ncbi:MAG: hypothetical protein ACJ766_12475 [Thermoleophilaceae bacterium]
MVLAAVTGFTREAQHQLRDTSHFHWSAVALLAFVFYVYAVEVERQRWDIILAGIALWAMDWFNEVANALVLHATDRAAIWTATGSTSYQILIGLNLEISMMFAVAGVVFCKYLPPRRTFANRAWLVLGFSCLCVFVEILLHAAGVFHWEYWWWNVPFVPLIVIFGYGTFFAMAAYVHDLPDNRRRLRVVGALAAIDAVGILLFGPILGWI